MYTEMLALVGPIKTMEQLALLLENTWARWSVLGERLFAMMVSLKSIEPELTKPTTSTKRTSGTTIDPNKPNLPVAKRRKQREVLPAEFPPSNYDTFLFFGHS